MKTDGKKLGRPFGSGNQILKLSNSHERIQELLSEGCTQSEISRIFGVNKSTVHRFLKKTNLFLEKQKNLLSLKKIIIDNFIKYNKKNIFHSKNNKKKIAMLWQSFIISNL